MILLVDDDPDILEACKMILESHKLHALCCTSGEQALEAFYTHQDDIATVITDYHMAKMNGLELIQAIRMHQPNMHCILISGNINEAVPQNITFLQKPFSFDKLMSELTTEDIK